MATTRKAGNDRDYEFRLWDKSENRVDRNIKLKFTSVTSVISATLAKPFLMKWEAKLARDMMTGAMSQLDPKTLLVPDEDGFCIWDYLCDSDEVGAWLDANYITSSAVLDEASDRGRKAHSFFEDLANIYLEGELEVNAAEGQARVSEKLHSHKCATPYEAAIVDWWETRYPAVYASESLLVSKRHDFAGTCDLVWEDNGVLTVTDLKTRKAGNGSYDSDHIQVGAYSIAFEEMTGLEVGAGSVLLAQDDGTWKEDATWAKPSTFLHLRSVYADLYERKAT